MQKAVVCKREHKLEYKKMGPTTLPSRCLHGAAGLLLAAAPPLQPPLPLRQPPQSQLPRSAQHTPRLQGLVSSPSRFSIVECRSVGTASDSDGTLR